MYVYILYVYDNSIWVTVKIKQLCVLRGVSDVYAIKLNTNIAMDGKQCRHKAKIISAPVITNIKSFYLTVGVDRNYIKMLFYFRYRFVLDIIFD